MAEIKPTSTPEPMPRGRSAAYRNFSDNVSRTRELLETKWFRPDREALRSHFYSILAVAIWGAFETYLISLLKEMRIKRPGISKLEEVIANVGLPGRREAALGLIAEKRLDRAGRFGLPRMLEYINDKLNFNSGAAKGGSLFGYHLLRNVIANNSGIVETDLEHRLPRLVKVKDGRVQLTKVSLQKMLEAMERYADLIEKVASKEFFEEFYEENEESEEDDP